MAYLTSGVAVSMDDNNAAVTLNTTNATRLTVGVGWYANRGTVALTDTYGNAWTLIGTITGSNEGLKIFRCLNAIVGASHVFTATVGGTSYPVIGVVAETNMHTMDAETVLTGFAINQTAILFGSSIAAPGFAVTFAVASGAQTLTIDSGFIVTVSGAGQDLSHSLLMGIAYKDGPSGSIQPTWTGTGNDSWCLGLVAYPAGRAPTVFNNEQRVSSGGLSVSGRG